MVETLAPQGYAGRLRTTLAACATFSVGALAGGAATFGGLALLGDALGAGGRRRLAVAAAVALAAAIGEARGARILPQVRRQVPESWRRRMPVPLAAGLYGVLLGLGFTTFILTFAVWALAGVSVALGDPALGLAIGLAFGAGRLLPVVVLAPAATTSAGAAFHAAMAERPRILRSLRAVDAVAHGGVLRRPGGLMATASRRGALRERPERRRRAAGLARRRPAGRARARRPGAAAPRHASGDQRCPAGRAARRGDRGHVDVGRAVPEPRSPRPEPTRSPSRRAGWRGARRRQAPTPSTRRRCPRGPPRLVLRLEELGRPALEGDRLAFHAAGRRGGRIVLADLAAGTRRVVRKERRAQLLNPSLHRGQLLYVRAHHSARSCGSAASHAARRAATGVSGPPPRPASATTATSAGGATRDTTIASCGGGRRATFGEPVDDRAGRGRRVRDAAASGRWTYDGGRDPARDR